MTPLMQYKTSQASSWTRVDMLLHIYEHAIAAVRNGANSLARGDNIDLDGQRSDVARKVMLIMEGLDLESGDVSQNIMRICSFVLEVVCENDPGSWAKAADLLELLRSAFESVQDVARQAEADGEIPALDFSAV